MKTPRFEYHAPRSVEEVLGLLAEHGDEAKVLAGGPEPGPVAGDAPRPARRISSTSTTSTVWPGSRERDGVVAFGALTRERAGRGLGAGVPTRYRYMAAALPHIGHISIRNRGTVGGSIAHADALAELPAVARITGAEMVVRSSTGERVVSAEDFFQGHFTTALGDEELLTEVRVPKGPAGAGWAFEEVARRRGDFALVGVAAMVALDGAGKVGEARLCLIGVADRPLRPSAAEAALVGAEPSTEAFVAAAEEAVRDLRPASDIHGSGEYRRQLARVTVRRSLEVGGLTSRKGIMSETIEFDVNGQHRSAEADVRMTLADFLRERLGLTGTHLGCEHGVCGACTVLVDGVAVRSCLMLAVQARGHQVTTVEGLADGDQLHPVQQAFRESHGFQCGFCTPGFVMMTTALLQENPHPSEEEVRDALSGNICRCTGYQSIVEGVLRAAQSASG